MKRAASSKSPSASKTAPVTTPKPSTTAETSWDEIDEASLESFPASDAPAWISRGSARA